MRKYIKHLLIAFLSVFFLSFTLTSPVSAQDGSNITPSDLIALVNGIRTGNGLPALEVSGILMSTAQSTAEIMAANRMGWHIGDVRGRVMAAGYGGGATAWATENFAVGPMSLEDIAWVWSDAAHMIPMAKPAYQHIGAGVATAADGAIYYIIHAAYTSGSPVVRTLTPGDIGANDPTAAAPQWVIPVARATPNTDGAIVHEVQMGQSLWSIAIAYETHIVDILRYNQLSPEQQVVWIGQKLNIPVTSTAVTPSPTAPAANIEATATLPIDRVAANVTVMPRVPTTLRLTSTTEPTRTQIPKETNAPEIEQTKPDMTILYVLGGIFTLGIILIVFGVLAKRSLS